MRTHILLCAAAALCISAVQASAQTPGYESDWESLDSRPIPAWFEDARFGIFIHWGIYSVPSYSPSGADSVGIYDRYAEHYYDRLEGTNLKTRDYFTKFHNRVYGEGFRYQDFAGQFKAEMFEPDRWADIIRRSGAKYVVLTSKHCEGFCLWPSTYSPHWNAVDIGPHRDLLGELTDAVRKEGVKMGYYYSFIEWMNPLFNKEHIDEYVAAHMIPQMKELVEMYRPDLLWADAEWDYHSDTWKTRDFLKWLFNDSPVGSSVVINDRWGKDCRSRHGGYYTTEYNILSGSESALESHPWEECRGMAGSFGFNRHEYLEDYSSSAELVGKLVDVVSRGGNLLLNIGPTGDGRIPVIMQQRLRDIGAWLEVCGEAIYGTRRWAGPETDGVRYTWKAGDDARTGSGTLYAFVEDLPSRPLVLKGAGPAGNVTLVGYDGKVEWTRRGNDIIIRPLKISSPSELGCNYVWAFRIEK